MPKPFSERLAALEHRQGTGGPMVHVRFMPDGLSLAEKEAWHQRETVPLRAAGRKVLAIEFVTPGAA